MVWKLGAKVLKNEHCFISELTLSLVACGFFQVILFCQFHLSICLVLLRQMTEESAAQINHISCLATVPEAGGCREEVQR